MKFVTYLDPKGKALVGLLADGAIPRTIIDAQAALDWMNTQPGNTPQKLATPATDVLTVIREQSSILPALRRVLVAHGEADSTSQERASSARFRPWGLAGMTLVWRVRRSKRFRPVTRAFQKTLP